ncbi:MAG: long-chain fatty acid--CoA ligase [Candidatus Heimdallarchaeota archaeon]|nr:long-chain fatty acid--CoA ligase [Candidatus Heimdallarchaeota archaeon]MDH5645958.1 long-chain fatty acid--CoA ligase [Candidatus Heimdallarchaeota archaeon]
MSKNAEIPMPWLKTIPEGRPTAMDYEEIAPFEFFKRRAENEPNDPCIILPKGKILTYGDVYDSVRRMGTSLTKYGIQKGDRVALLFGNVPHYIISHYAVLGIGGTVVQANPLYTEHELRHLINDSGAKALIGLTMFQKTVNRLLDDTSLEFVVYGRIQDYLKGIVKFMGKLLRVKPLFDKNDPRFDGPKLNVSNTYNFSDFIMGPDEFVQADVDIKNDVAILQYTGGTTGFPKGAMLTHYNLSVNAQQARATVHMVPDKEGSILTVLPLFHVFGLTACMNLSFQLGIPLVLNIKSPPDFGELLKFIQKYKISFFPAVPRMIIEINKHPNTPNTDFSSLVAVITGGAALPVEVGKEFYQLTGAHCVEGFGLSETSPLTHVNPIGLEPVEGSIGLPAPDTLAKIVDIDDYNTLMPLGEAGELCVKGPQVMKGYWGMENQTKQVLKDDGWFRTGDIAKIDENGYTYIVDRKKDMIIVSGYNVYPREVEEVLFMHDAVQEAAVAGMTHESKGEMVVAWIVVKEGMNVTEKEIKSHCKEYMAPYKIPKKVIFKDELPTTMIGKVLRRKLQEEDVEIED